MEFRFNPLHVPFTYTEVWSRYRGILHVLSVHLGVPAEQLEREVDAWIKQNQQALVREAKERLDRFDAA